jgi:hypothetical protein
MKIPRVSTGEFSGKDWSSSDGKGSKPRNLSTAFKTNFDTIRWGPKDPVPASGFTRITYRAGKKVTTFAG